MLPNVVGHTVWIFEHSAISDGSTAERCEIAAVLRPEFLPSSADGCPFRSSGPVAAARVGLVTRTEKTPALVPQVIRQLSEIRRPLAIPMGLAVAGSICAFCRPNPTSARSGRRLR